MTAEASSAGQRAADGPRLLAVSDLHVGFGPNRAIAERLRPENDADWLIVAGDVGERAGDIEHVLSLLSERFAKVIWVPGNHELWTHGRDPVRLRGEARYLHLVEVCRRLGVLTPEDPYPVWQGDGGPLLIAPLFLLYDYSFRPDGAGSIGDGLDRARAAGVVSSDERLLHPDPYPSREAWCADRLAKTEQRLAALPPGTATVLVNHFPLVREPTTVMRYPEFAQWCGTVRTADWPTRFGAVAVVYGHLHIPRTTWHDGVRHEEVSLGYPREWKRRASEPVIPRQILPAVTGGPPDGYWGRPARG
ncbi:MAG TPA: metallophosphoesterase [Streptosporangiaceae bacterium]|nr:metallophosphoesterase [Streptosporangiaceae bacterium]